MSAEVMISENQARIRKNKRRIFELENWVTYNTANAMLTRSEIEENRALLQRNYQSSFMGNRSMALQNTDDLFRSRMLMLEALETDTAVQQNFKGWMVNRTKLDQLDIRSGLNRKMLEINQKMVEVNRLLIEVNQMVAEANQEVVECNADMIVQNAAWIDGELDQLAAAATPEANQREIEENTRRIDEFSARAESNGKIIEELMVQVGNNTKAILDAGDTIEERRKRIMQNREKIIANQHRSADFLLPSDQ